MAVGDHQDARFARERRKRPNKTGLHKTNVWIFKCNSCGKTYRVKHDHAPEYCGAKLHISGGVCGGEEFTVYNRLELEAMPQGRSYIDMRSPSQMGRKGKVR
jgi:hypothetical protein